MSKDTGVEVSWIYELKKDQIIEQLKDYGIKLDIELNVEELRKLLRKAVLQRAEKSGETNSETVNSEQSGSTEKDKNSLEENIINKESSPNIKVQEITNTVEVKAMAETKVKLDFEVGRDDWETFIERLELYFAAHGITDTDKQKALLLTKVSAKTYILIRDLCAPTKPKDKKYEEIVELVNKHLCPARSETFECYKFHQATQQTSESVVEFTARLKKMALHCNFGKLEEALRDQLVCGLSAQESRVLLFREEKLTFEKAYKIASSQERAKENAHATENISKVEVPHQSMNYLKGNNAKKLEKGQSMSKNKNPATCICCGGENHWSKNCRHRYKNCNFWQMKGHLENMCRNKNQQNKPSHKKSLQYLEGETEDKASESDHDFYHLRIQKLHSLEQEEADEPLFLNLFVNNVELQMEIDSGTYLSVISDTLYSASFSKIELNKTSVVLKSYGGHRLFPLGFIAVQVKYQNEMYDLKLYVLPNPGPALIGRHWLRALGLWPPKLPSQQNLNKIESCNMKEKIISEFQELFNKKSGLFKLGTFKLNLKPGTRPVALKASHLPYALKSKIETEIDRLLREGHLEKVEASEWATPIVPIMKTNGEVRICGNFKLTINPHLIISKRPLPTTNDVFVKLEDSEIFSEVDLEHAYMQIPVEEGDRDYLTIITHKGMFRYTKLAEGVSAGPADFQEKWKIVYKI